MKYLFSDYNGQTGVEKEFDSFDEAVMYGWKVWNHLTLQEREVYFDPENGAWCAVFSPNAQGHLVPVYDVVEVYMSEMDEEWEDFEEEEE